MYVIHLHAEDGICAKTKQSSNGSYETENKQCGSCIPTTKLVTRTNYNNKYVFKNEIEINNYLSII